MRGGSVVKKNYMIVALLSITILGLFGGVEAAKESVNLITAIEIRGNIHISSEEILGLISTRPGDLVEEEKLAKDYQTVNEFGVFEQVQMNFEQYLGGVKLVIDVKEYPLIRQIIIEGAYCFAETTLIEQMTLQPGQVFNSQILKEDLRKVREFYQSQGYLIAHIRNFNIDYSGVMTIKLNEGYVGQIILKGNEKTKDYVILREMELKPGDVFHADLLRSDIYRIYRRGYIEDAQSHFEQNLDDLDQMDLVIELKERKTGDFHAGTSLSTKDGWLGFVEAKEKNLFGRGQELGIKWEFGQIVNYKLSFYDPWIFGQEFSMGFDLYNTTRNGKTDLSGGTVKYTEHSMGGSVTIGKSLTDHLRGSLKYKYENSRTVWQSNDPDEVNKLRSLTFGLNRNTVDDPFNPHSGGVERGMLEYAGQLLGGNADFTKVSVDFRRYYPGVLEPHTWAFRVKSGIAFGSLPHNENFKLGGAETLRGYSTGFLTGDKMVLLNMEYRIPIVEKLQGVVFTDLGNAWDQNGDLNDMKFSGGVGVRMDTPLGQIRIDYAVGEDKKGMPHFSIGQTF